MKRRLAPILTTLALLTTLAPGLVDASGSSLTIYGDAGYQPSSTAATFIGSVADLSTITYGNGSVDCPRGIWQLQNPRSWINCVSSFKFSGDCHHGVKFYGLINYSSLERTVWGTTYVSSLSSQENDTYESIQFVSRPTCPVSPTG